MSVRPTLLNLIGAKLEESEVKLFKEFVLEHGDMTVAELLKDEPMLSQELDFPIPLDYLDMTLESVATYPESGGVVGFYPLYHKEDARLHDHQLIWSLIESGILPKEGFSQRISYEDYSASIGAPREELLKLPLSVRMDMRHYEGKWGRKYQHSPMNYFDEEFDLSLALFERMGVELERRQMERFVILEWG